MFQLSLISTIFLLSSFIVATEAIKCNNGRGLATKPVDCAENVTQCLGFMFDFSEINETNLVSISLKTSTYRCDSEWKCKDIDRFNTLTAGEYVKVENISFEEEFGITQKDWDTKVDYIKAAVALAENPNDRVAKKNFALALFLKAKMRMRCCNTDLCNTLTAQ